MSVTQKTTMASMPRNVRREQKFPPGTHLYLQGRLVTFYLNWSGQSHLVVIPHQKVFKLTQIYPVDLGFMFSEIYNMMEQKRVQNFSIHTFKRDWNIAPHLFFKVCMGQEVYNTFATSPHHHMSAGTFTLMPPAVHMKKDQESKEQETGASSSSEVNNA